MRIFAITVCHGPAEVLAFSLSRFMLTAGINPEHHVILSHCWPINRVNNDRVIKRVGKMIEATVLDMDRNIGGHQGFNHALNWIRERYALKDEDLVCGYDHDSNPITDGWLRAAREVFSEESTLTSLSLMHNHILDRPWKMRGFATHKIAFLPHPEMCNVTVWKNGAIPDGLPGQGFYGHTERFVWQAGKNGYLYDFREDLCPIPHPESYSVWKRRTAFGGYTKNYDEFLKESF